MTNDNLQYSHHIVIGEIIFKRELGNVEPILNSNTLSKLIKLIKLMYIDYNVEFDNCFAYKLECHYPSIS